MDQSIERTTVIFDKPFGTALVMGPDKACGHAREVLSSAAPEKRILLMSDREATQFRSSAGIMPGLSGKTLIR